MILTKSKGVEMIDYYNLTAEETLKALNTTEQGLCQEEVESRLKQYGYNILQKEHKFQALKLWISQFNNAFLLLLAFAGTISLFLGETIESIVIFCIILLNAFLGFIQEYRAEKAIEALEKMSAPTARVLRDDKETKIPASNIVPGDILLLDAGDIVPADSRIISVTSLQIDEASLTGESVPSKKITQVYPLGTSIADQENMAFKSTTITYGKGKSIVTNTGMNTEVGKIASSIQTTKESPTPLQQKFKQLAKQIGIITIALIIIILILGMMRGEMTFVKMLVFILALTVSTIPNSLPIIVTISLSMGAKKLAKKNMLIRKLPAAESLGATTIICSDKTGTLTKNQMTATTIFTNKKIINITGAGYTPKGEFLVDNIKIKPQKIELLLRIGYLCNNAKLTETDRQYSIIGDPTEGALIVLGKKGLEEQQIKQNFTKIEELPFDSERKRMTVIYKNNNKTEAYTKGAPDLLLSLCDKIIINGKTKKLTHKERQKILETNNTFAQKALRVLALAYRDISNTKNYNIKTVEKKLTFIALVGMIDPPRDEVKFAVNQCEQAGIKVMMITGDHALTAKAVANQIGMLEHDDIILTGTEVDKMSDDELLNKIDKVKIIARALPIQKSRIVDILQKKGHIVAMTGDGVNDAPALKKADIGIAMGITGTDVAKEVAKATLVDDNFATIVNAIAEGRNIYEKMIKSATYLLSCNTGEITTVFLAILSNLPLPMLPLQLLIMSLLTDDFPAIGLGLEKQEEDIMNQPPRDPQKKPITGKILISMIVFGLIMGIGTFLMFTQYQKYELPKAQTIAFTTLVMFQMFAVISSRTLKHSIKHLNPLSNKFLFTGICLSILLQILVIYTPVLQNIFGTVALTGLEWLQIIGLASLGFIMMEASKFFTHNNNQLYIYK